jgi:hypothetical protein
MTSIIAFTNNGNGNYTVQFSDTVTYTPQLQQEPAAVMSSPGSEGWIVLVWLAQLAPDTMQATDVQSDADCTAIALLGQPVNLTAANLFQTATPIVQAT